MARQQHILIVDGQQQDGDELAAVLTQQQPVDRVHLMREIWGETPELQSHAVEAMIYRLRQMIEPRPGRPSFLIKRRN